MSSPSEKTTVVVAMYHFVTLDDIEALKPRLLHVCVQNQIKGTILFSA